MAAPNIKFTDGPGYERYMGIWSRLAGESFLAWLAPQPGLRWLDIGCGNGAFTEMIGDRCAPASIDGIDPSEAQLEFARTRFVPGAATFRQGDGMALPYPDDSFDAAVMPLVIFFLPVPAQGVAEMARVVAPGGSVTAYAWDMPGHGFPYDALQAEMSAMGIIVPKAPSPEASRLEVMQKLWADAGLRGIETRAITVQRTFADFEDYWGTVLKGPSVAAQLAALAPNDTESLRAKMRERFPADASGKITYGARAHAVKGVVV